MTLPSFTRRAFLVPALFLATLVGFSQANEASAQSLQGTWEFTWYEVTNPQVPIGTRTVEVDKKAKSFKSVELTGGEFPEVEFVIKALKINPAKNTFECLFAEGASSLGYFGFAGVGEADLDQGIIHGAGTAFTGNELGLEPDGPPVVFIGIKQ